MPTDRSFKTLTITAALSLGLSACSAPVSYWMQAPDAYGNQISYELRQTADAFKAEFIERRLEEEQVLEDQDMDQLREALALEYERSVRTLFSGSLSDEEGLADVLSLVGYAPGLFRAKPFENQLKLRSKSLYNLHIDMQIHKAFCTADSDVYES